MQYMKCYIVLLICKIRIGNLSLVNIDHCRYIYIANMDLHKGHAQYVKHVAGCVMNLSCAHMHKTFPKMHFSNSGRSKT